MRAGEGDRLRGNAGVRVGGLSEGKEQLGCLSEGGWSSLT